MNDNMFRPIHLFQFGPSSRQTLVTKDEFYNAYSVIQCDVDVNEISFLSYKTIQVCVYSVYIVYDTYGCTHNGDEPPKDCYITFVKFHYWNY
jgi:hypothetical protein